MSIEKQVADYYSSWEVEDEDLHIGGRSATEYFAPYLKLESGMRVLDVGSGVGGPARFVAERYGVQVDGLDLSPDFCEKARALSADDRTIFHEGSALDMPFDDGVFDAAYTMHVGMNIADKAGVYAEVHRVLKSGAVFGIYDVMAGKKRGDLPFPVPWALTHETSFLRSSIAVCELLEAAGFEIIHQENRRDFALSSIPKMIESDIYDDLRARLENLLSAVQDDLCTPEIIVCKRV